MESYCHRAFIYISKKWQSVVFRNHEIIKDLAEQTTTQTGFSVKAYINDKIYQTGKKASEEFMKTMLIFSIKFYLNGTINLVTKHNPL